MALLRDSKDSLHLPCDYHALLEKLVAKRQIGFGKIGQPLRVALLGSMSGAGLDEIMAILGVDETLSRIEKILKS
jgi:glutamyl-tRNA synthetase